MSFAKELEFFDLVDSDHNGYIDFEELKRFFEITGMKATDEEIMTLIKLSDVNNDKCVDVREVKVLLETYKILCGFKEADKDKDGYVDSRELRYLLIANGEYVSLDEVEKIIGLVDVNNDGKLDFAEFVSLLRSQ